jgi:hypothetical protein
MPKTTTTLAVAAIAIVVASCDPQKAALKVFTDQGLHVLKPARTYVEVGGIVVLPKRGIPYYVDRRDPLPADPGSTINFDSIIPAELKKESSGFGVALAAIQGILPVSLNAKFDREQTVQLSQIKAPGTRLNFDTLSSLLSGSRTGPFLTETLKAGRSDRVFLVWEVYRAEGFTLKATKAMDIGIGIDLELPAPSLPASAPTAAATAAAKPTVVGTTTAVPSSLPAASTPSSTSTSSTTPSPTASTTPQATPSPSSDLSGTWKRRGEYELGFTATTPYPFAVRLAEVVMGNGGRIELRPGGFKFPASLGATNLEKYTAAPDESGPSIAMERRAIP